MNFRARQILKTALVEPYSVVLSYEAARKLVCRLITRLVNRSRWVELGTYTVTGVMKKLRIANHIIVFDALCQYIYCKESGIRYEDIDRSEDRILT
jgi:hypothetical protein